MSSDKRVRPPHRTKSKRRLTAGRMLLYRAAVGLARAIVDGLWWTCRIRVVGAEKLQDLLREHGAIVPVCWHQHLLISGRFIVSRKAGALRPGFMISPSVDGEAPAMLARSYGGHIVRGSSTYTGLRAMRGAHQAMVEGISPLITPDGPRGPRFRFKPGAIFAAQLTGKPVVPLAFAARPAWVFKSWDKFVLPVPFGRICIAIGEPYFAPAQMDGPALEQAQRDLERRMLEAYRRAARELGGPDSGPGRASGLGTRDS